MNARVPPDDEPYLRDADGNVIVQYDEVELLREVALDYVGRCADPPDPVPAGTRAAVIFLFSGNAVHLECYIGDLEFVFATEDAGYVRLFRRIEDRILDEPPVDGSVG